MRCKARWYSRAANLELYIADGVGEVKADACSGCVRGARDGGEVEELASVVVDAAAGQDSCQRCEGRVQA